MEKKKPLSKHYHDQPRFKVTLAYEKDFKDKFEESSMRMTKEILTLSSKLIEKN